MITWQLITVNGTINNIQNGGMFTIEEVSGESVLTVTMVTKSYEGVYQCVGTNGVSNLIGTPEQDSVIVTVQGMDNR